METTIAKSVCDACEDFGWLYVSVDGNEPPPGMLFVQKCDECGKFADDIAAAEAYAKSESKAILGMLVRA